MFPPPALHVNAGAERAQDLVVPHRRRRHHPHIPHQVPRRQSRRMMIHFASAARHGLLVSADPGHCWRWRLEHCLTAAEKRVERQVRLPVDQVRRGLPHDAVGEERRHLHAEGRAH